MNQTEIDIREHLESFATDVLDHIRDETIRPAESFLALDTGRYVDSAFYDAERKQIFQRLPILLAASAELSGTGQYKTIDVAGIPVLLLRAKDGKARAYLNSCPHRGAAVASGEGTRQRFTCPYHGWTFSLEGQLLAAPLMEEFGDPPAKDVSLIQLPVYESSGLIWATLNRKQVLEPDRFFAGFDQFLSVFELENWHFHGRRYIPGPNWKLAFEAHLEFYHLPVLHKNSFGPQTSNKALYYFWGPHQRLIQAKGVKAGVPDERNLFKQSTEDQSEWPLASMMLGEWIIFPNVSINIFYDGGLGMLISQVVPGESADTSVTIQTYLMAEEANESELAEATSLCDFLEQVVGKEDIPTSDQQQISIQSGMLDTFIIGKNEAGIQHFHQWVDNILAASDDELASVFEPVSGWT